jgi:hypothetical protein
MQDGDSLEQSRIGSVHDSDTLAGDVSIDSSEPAEDDIIPHNQGILSSPVP